jgi:hypothetical protein
MDEGRPHRLHNERRPADSSFASTVRRAALLLALSNMTGCSNMAMPTAAIPAGPDPSYGTLIATNLKTTFKKLSPSDPVEISKPRWIQAMTGWNWLVCVHFNEQGHRRTYVYFINGNAIVASRYSVQTDDCGAQTYLSLDLSSGAITAAGSGEPAPIY